MTIEVIGVYGRLGQLKEHDNRGESYTTTLVLHKCPKCGSNMLSRHSEYSHTESVMAVWDRCLNINCGYEYNDVL